MTEKPQILEYRSSKSPSVLPTHGMEQNLGNARGTSCLICACKTRVKVKTETKMRMKWMLTTFILMGMAALTGTAAYGQAGAPEGGQPGKAAPARAAERSSAQTDVGVSGYFAMTKATSGNGTQQTPTNAPGGMLELRHIHSTLIGYEMAFSYNPADQAYVPKHKPGDQDLGQCSRSSACLRRFEADGEFKAICIGRNGLFHCHPGRHALWQQYRSQTDLRVRWRRGL